MNTLQINRKLKKYPNFLGAYARDQIPYVSKRPVALIVNTDTSKGEGEHWVAIFLKENKTGEYFDSFGMPPLHEEIIKYLNINCLRGWKYNTITLQGVTSSTCGNYCVLYASLRCKNYKYDEIIQLFTKEPFHNDKIVLNLCKNV